MKHPVLSVAQCSCSSVHVLFPAPCPTLLLIQFGHPVSLVQMSYFDLLYAKTSRLLILPAQEWHLRLQIEEMHVGLNFIIVSSPVHEPFGPTQFEPRILCGMLPIANQSPLSHILVHINPK